MRGTQALWDPRRVDDLPTVDADDGLPATVEPPSSSASLSTSPIEAAVLAVAKRHTAQLLSTTGEWRSVPLTGRYPRLALSPGGTQLLVWHGDDDAVEVHDLASGARRSLRFPGGFQPWDFSRWVWIDERTVLLDDLRGGWLVDTKSAESERVPYPREFAWTVDPDGWVVETSDYHVPADLTDWVGGSERRVSQSTSGRLLSLQADRETVVGTSYGTRPFSIVVADRETLRPGFVLPLGDHEGNYSNGGISVLSLRADGTVLLRVQVLRGQAPFRVVRWDPRVGDLAVIASVETPIEHVVTFASGLLRTEGRT